MLVSKTIGFAAGHCVTGHKHISSSGKVTEIRGKCHNLHGHNYKATFTYSGNVQDDGMVVDFNLIKHSIGTWVDKNWDHRFLIWREDTRAELLQDTDASVVLLDFIPTAENMASFLVVKANDLLQGSKARCHSVVLEETDSCKVEAV